MVFALTKKAEENGLKCFVPAFEYCTDNAAMIGSAAYYAFRDGIGIADMSLAPKPSLSLEDYLYNGDDLRELKGRKYHSKRNHLSNFRKNYPDYEYQSLTADMLEDVWEYINLWCKQKECSGKFSPGLICEKQAIREALDHFGELDYKGAVIRLNGQIEAFTMGEKINDETVVIHVEKANGTINGLYSAINQEFLLHQWPDVAFVNREEDTGDEGLRKAKMSYHPVALVKKYKGVYQA